jgi:hypothetical protein
LKNPYFYLFSFINYNHWCFISNNATGSYNVNDNSLNWIPFIDFLKSNCYFRPKLLRVCGVATKLPNVTF